MPMQHIGLGCSVIQSPRLIASQARVERQKQEVGLLLTELVYRSLPRG